MSQYWVIAPYSSDYPVIWESVWQFDLDNSLISIGWSDLKDISQYSEEELRNAVESAYPDESAGNKTKIFNMLWDFYHNIEIGDIVIARRGRKKIAAVGTVTNTAYFSSAKNVEASGEGNAHSNYIDVQWHETPRDKSFDRIVFGMQTIYSIDESRYKMLIEEGLFEVEEGIKNQTEFVLEKYLEDFIVTNFDRIFENQLALYVDPEEKVIGQQYATEVGIIDILALEPSTNAFVVIELKKGRESDKVIGQTLRYMGWVSENLCQDDQDVKGLVICRDSDIKLSYALKMTTNVSVKYYRIDFKLSSEPVKV